MHEEHNEQHMISRIQHL